MKIEIVKHRYGPVVADVDIFETDETDAYEAVSQFIDKVCEAVEYSGEMIISIGTKHCEDEEYHISNQYFDGAYTWENDWWEGESYIRIYGWCFIDNLKFYPGVGDCWIVQDTGRSRRYGKL